MWRSAISPAGICTERPPLPLKVGDLAAVGLAQRQRGVAFGGCCLALGVQHEVDEAMRQGGVGRAGRNVDRVQRGDVAVAHRVGQGNQLPPQRQKDRRLAQRHRQHLEAPAEFRLGEQQLDLERDHQRELGQSEDFKEGVAAFLAKRKPAFKGK